MDKGSGCRGGSPRPTDREATTRVATALFLLPSTPCGARSERHTDHCVCDKTLKTLKPYNFVRFVDNAHDNAPEAHCPQFAAGPWRTRTLTQTTARRRREWSAEGLM